MLRRLERRRLARYSSWSAILSCHNQLDFNSHKARVSINRYMNDLGLGLPIMRRTYPYLFRYSPCLPSLEPASCRLRITYETSTTARTSNHPTILYPIKSLLPFMLNSNSLQSSTMLTSKDINTSSIGNPSDTEAPADLPYQN